MELIVASALWGFGFIAARWLFEALGPSEVTFLRFAIAGTIGIPFVIYWRKAFSLRSYLYLSAIPAVFLLGTLIFQTWGLKYTSATKSGFITTLYVVIIPLIESLRSRKRFPLQLWMSVLMALGGTALIVNIGISDLNYGDLLTLACAVLAAAHIYWVGIIGPKVQHPFVFNFMQCYWCLIGSFFLVDSSKIGAAFANPGELSAQFWVGLLALSVGSTVLAFSLQVKAQRHLSPTVASLLCLLESPFAMFFSQMFLAESLTALELLGAGLILISAVSAILIEARSRRETLARQ